MTAVSFFFFHSLKHPWTLLLFGQADVRARWSGVLSRFRSRAPAEDYMSFLSPMPKYTNSSRGRLKIKVGRSLKWIHFSAERLRLKFNYRGYISRERERERVEKLWKETVNRISSLRHIYIYIIFRDSGRLNKYRNKTKTAEPASTRSVQFFFTQFSKRSTVIAANAHARRNVSSVRDTFEIPRRGQTSVTERHPRLLGSRDYSRWTGKGSR